MENTPITPRPRRTDRYRSEQNTPAMPIAPDNGIVQENPVTQDAPARQAIPTGQQWTQSPPNAPAWYAQAIQQHPVAEQNTQQHAPSAPIAPAAPVAPVASVASRPAVSYQRPVQTPMAQQPLPTSNGQPAWTQPAAQQAPTRQRAMPYPAHPQASSAVPQRNAQPYSMQHATARRSQPAPAPSQQATEEVADNPNRLPIWLTWSIVGVCLVLMALLAGHYMMQAYLTTRAQEWADAYQATLNNYHVVEQPNGQNTITYQALIECYATQYNLQPAFVAAIIRNESSFRTDAESSVGARGLMQLMPDTAEWIAGKLDDDSYSFDNMYDAETNIRYGCWYLNYLSRLFRGDAVLVSSAYHAGQTTVTRWLSDKSISSDGLTIPVESLPDGPTKQYAGRVTTSYGIYQTLLYPSN